VSASAAVWWTMVRRWSVVFVSSRGRRYPASAANRARSRLFQEARRGALLYPTCRALSIPAV
jgi:hypothetical protein